MISKMTTLPDRAWSKEPFFTSFNDLVAEQLGGGVLFATDDWFAPAESLLKEESPVYKEGETTNYGMWMDGWETRRRHTEGHDWCVIQLGLPGVIHGIDVDTSFFTGNFAPRCSIQAAYLSNNFSKRDGERIGTAASAEDYRVISGLKSEDWEYIVPLSQLQPGFQTSCHNYFTCSKRNKYTHIRLNIYPDGGIARLRVYGQTAPNWTSISDKELLDVSSVRRGCVCVGYSSSDIGHPKNLIKHGRAKSIQDGWEILPKSTRPSVVQEERRTGRMYTAGSEWCIFQLGHPCIVEKVEIDTNHFKGNFPYSCRVEGCYIDNRSSSEISIPGQKGWKTLLPDTRLKGHNQIFVDSDKLNTIGVISHVRLTIEPDGGISRFRIWGYKASGHSAKL